MRSLQTQNFDNHCTMPTLRKESTMTQKLLKLALEFVESVHDGEWGSSTNRNELVAAIKEALAQTQEPVAWVSEDVCKGQYIDGRPRKIWWECEKGVGTAFYTTPPQRTKQELIAYLYNMGYKAGHHDTLEGTYIDIFRQDMSTYHSDVVSEWLEDEGYTTPPQRTEQNFCSRCGKRVGNIDSIHTCTPPMEKNT